MAAITDKSNYWGKETGLSKSEVGYVKHLRDLPLKSVVARTAVVIGTAGIGAAIGAAAGAPAGGIGAGPGAGIGAGVGALVGAAGCSIYDVSKYLDYRSSLNIDARQNLDELINDPNLCNKDDICPITKRIPVIPVRIAGEKQTYEKEALEEWQKKKGTNPLTREPFKYGDITASFEKIARTGKLCDLLLNDPAKRRTLTEVQLKGVALLREETLERTNQMYEVKVKTLLSEVKARKISPREMVAEMAELADVLDPIIGNEANENRVEIDVKSIVIPAHALKASGRPADEMKV